MEQYFVEPCRRTWNVKFEGDYIAAFPSQAEAIRWAAERAHNAKARLEEARVLVRAEDGTFEVAWNSTPRDKGFESAA
jgi:Uncharacterized protein conserved in bacteria (DUF2188)